MELLLPRPLLAVALASILLAPWAASSARADGVYKDRERVARPAGRLRRLDVQEVEVRPPMAERRTGYVGSAWGLGKPNYYGLSPRPDDGYRYGVGIW